MLEFSKTYVSLKNISGVDKMDGYFFRGCLNVNNLVSFDHHSNIIVAALGLEVLLPCENPG